MRPPACDDLFDFLAIVVGIGEGRLTPKPGEDRGHILTQMRIEIGKLGQVETTVHVRVPSGEDEVGNAPSLAGVLMRDVEEFFESKSNADVHAVRPLKRSRRLTIVCRSA